MPNGIDEFKKWLERNDATFKADGADIKDIANLAIACGFDRQVVAQWQTTQKFRRINP